jgi:hypothetical protein
MPAHVSILQLVTVVVFALATAVWAAGLVRLRRQRFGSAVRRRASRLGAMPQQRRTAPPWESVELTPAERDAFAGLVRRFGDGRFRRH